MKTKHLGHIINNDLTDDKDIERERKSLATRGNLIVQKFHPGSDDVKLLCLNVTVISYMAADFGSVAR